MVKFVIQDQQKVFAYDENSIYAACRDLGSSSTLIEIYDDFITETFVFLGYRMEFPKDLDQRDKEGLLDQSKSIFAYAIDHRGIPRIRYDNQFQRGDWDPVRPAVHYVGTRLTEIYDKAGRVYLITKINEALERNQTPDLSDFFKLIEIFGKFDDYLEYCGLDGKLKRKVKR